MEAGNWERFICRIRHDLQAVPVHTGKRSQIFPICAVSIRRALSKRRTTD
jgi:hypothetical protein